MLAGPLYSEPPRNALVSVAVAVCRKMALPHRAIHSAAAFTSHSSLRPELSSSSADRKAQTGKLGHDMESRAKRRAAKAFKLTHAAIASSVGLGETVVGEVHASRMLGPSKGKSVHRHVSPPHNCIVVGAVLTRALTTSTNRSCEGCSQGICFAMAIRSFHSSQRKPSISDSALLNMLTADWLISSAMVAAVVVLEGCR
ncbi:hypothetical protein BJX96DRAFT_142302 [Aspergillus floccosus]